MELAVELVVKDGLEVVWKNRCITECHSEIGKKKSPEMVQPYSSKKFDQLQPAKGRNKKRKSTVFILSSMVEPANETTSFVKASKKKLARRLMKDAGLSSSDEEGMPLAKMIKAGMVQDNSDDE